MVKISKIPPKLSDFIAGLISGLINVTYSLSYAALIFPGELSEYLPFGVACALITASITGLIVALQSSLPFIISGPDSNAAAILAVMVASIVQKLSQQGQTAAIFPTIWLAVVLSTVVTGLSLWVLGRLHLGRFIRFVPYPVVGGFLAGLGWLFARGSFTVMTGIALDFNRILGLLQLPILLLWLPGLGLGIALYIILPRYKHFLVFPTVLVSALALGYLGLGLTGTSFEVAREQGFFFSTTNQHDLSLLNNFSLVLNASWFVLSFQLQSLVTLLAVVPVTILLNATGLELATQADVDLDQELQTAGIANLVAGLFSGMVGHFSISRTLLNYAAGGRHRSSGIFAALFCALFLVLGTAILNYSPKFIFGGLLFYLGLSLLVEWVYQGWFKLSRLDYGLVLIMLLTIARFGLLEGVGVGVMIACLLFVVNYSNLRVIKNTLSGNTYQSNFERSFHQKKLLRRKGDELFILRLQGYIFFGTSNSLFDYIRHLLQEQKEVHLKFLVLDFQAVGGLDSSALVSFLKIKQLTQKAGISLIFTSLPDKISFQLQEGGIIASEAYTLEPSELEAWIAKENDSCFTFPDLDRGVEWCENQMLKSGTFRRKRFMPLAIQLEEFFPLPDLVTRFVNAMEKINTQADYCLFRQGDPSDALYFVESGQVSLIREWEDGQSERLGTFGEGTVIGEVGFYNETPRPATAVTDRPCRLYRLSHETLQKMAENSPELVAACHQLIARFLADRVIQADERSKRLLQ